MFCCFWHGHKGCRYATKPKTNVGFWETKIARNRHRDEVTTAHLEALGWTVITVWECELRGKLESNTRLDKLADEIRFIGESKKRQEAVRQQNRSVTKKQREEILHRQSQLEAEIDLLFPIPPTIKKASLEE